MKASRPRSPSHSAKNKTPEDRVWEFGSVLGERGGRLLCRACNLALDHTRRSTIVEHLRSRKHHKFLEEAAITALPTATIGNASTSNTPFAGIAGAATSLITPAVIYVDGGEDVISQDVSDSTSPSPSNKGLVGPYLLKKETHCSSVLDQLLRDDTYTDVTLTAEGQSLRAHRIVLCLASSYFRQVLSREQNVQSVVLLRDVKFAELRNIIHFIYTGEATVDASELESFMKTAEMLEISSLCEGQKCITSLGLNTHGGASSGFSIGDFERLVGSKRTRKESSPSPNKSRRISDETTSPRRSSDDPVINPLAIVKEEPGCDSTILPREPLEESEIKVEEDLDSAADHGGDMEELSRQRRESAESVGGFAAMAGIQKVPSHIDDSGEDVFPTLHVDDSAMSSHSAESAKESLTTSDPEMTTVPGRCPYCPHISVKYEGVAMMRHLLVSHPCKPAFPCSTCWRVFVKKSTFKNHLHKCQLPIV